MPTKNITIKGLPVGVSAPYVEGHVMTEAEAKSLNQTRAEAIRNNTAKLVATAIETAGLDFKVDPKAAEKLDAGVVKDLLAKISDYDKNYVFTLASVGGGRTPVDPVEKEARRLAKDFIVGSLKEQGRLVKDVPKEKMEVAVAKAAEAPEIQKQAKANIKARNAMAATAIEDLDL